MRRRWNLYAACGRMAVVAAGAMSLLMMTAGLDVTAADDEPVKAKKAIYDEKADASKLVNDALKVAARDHKHVLLMFGGNWCGWCHKLHELFQTDAEIARTLNSEYILVMVDTQAPKAVEVIERFDVRIQGVPFLTILDPAGKVVAHQETGALEEGDHHVPAKVLDVLKRHAPEPLDAKSVLTDALARARSEDKRVFLHFGAPWCGWCHKLEDFLGREEIAAIMTRDFIDVKIDTDRMTNADAVLERYGAEGKGIPWFAVLDAQGEAIATSDGPDGNIGYPVMPAERAHFIAMLKKVARQIEPDQIGTIDAALAEAAGPILEALERRATR